MRIVFDLEDRHIDIIRRLSEKYGLSEDEVVKRSIDALDKVDSYTMEEDHPFKDFIRRGDESGLHMILNPGDYLYLNLIKDYLVNLGFKGYPDLEEFNMEYSLSNIYLGLTGPPNLKLAWVDVYDDSETSNLDVNYTFPDDEVGNKWIEKFESISSDIEGKLIDELGECAFEYEVSKEYREIFLKITLDCEDIPNLKTLEEIIEREVGEIPKTEE